MAIIPSVLVARDQDIVFSEVAGGLVGVPPLPRISLVDQAIQTIRLTKNDA